MTLLDALGPQWSSRLPPVMLPQRIGARCPYCGDLFRNFPLWLHHSRTHWAAHLFVDGNRFRLRDRAAAPAARAGEAE